MTNWSSIIEQYPATQQYTYLNTPSCGLISRTTADNASQYYQTFLQHGGQERQEWYGKIISLKEKLAEFINAENDEIALLSSFSVGMNFVVLMLSSLDKVLLLDHDYPSLCLPWLLHKYKLYYQAWERDGTLNLEKMTAIIKKEKIKVVAVSHVQYQTGYCLDIKALGKICRENRALLLVDATQSLGTMPINVQAMQVDLLIASGYKWMTAGFGNALLYMNKELLDQFQQPVVGNNSLDGFPDFKNSSELPFNMRSFEVGHFAFASFLNMAHALEEIMTIGTAQIQARNQKLMAYLYQNLGDRIITSYPPKNRSSIAVLKGDQTLHEKLTHQNIATTIRGKGIRVGLHFYNTEEDVDILANALT